MKMIRPFLLVLTAALSLLSILSQRAEASEYARVCVSTADGASNEAPLDASSAPGSKTKVMVHLDASAECAALIVPLLKNGSRLANGWRPQFVSLPQWDEKVLPATPAVWSWKEGDSFELWVFFFNRDAAGLEEIRKLVTTMQNSTANDQMLAQQTRKLCERLGERMSGKEEIAHGPKANAALVGGRTRSTSFPWRDYALKVVLNGAREGKLVLRHGR